MTTKPWARYLRLSKAEAMEDRGKTAAQRLALTNAKLDTHLAELTAWMDREGIPYADDLVFRDAGLSAWKPRVRRPGWETMMDLAKAGHLGGIGIVAVDRFTRDVTTMEDLIKLAGTTDVRIGGPRAGNLDLTTYDGIVMARGMAVQAANESLATSARIRSTLKSKMAAGQPMGGGRPYGFETGGMTQRPAEAAVVREMATRMVAGEPVQRLAAEMNARGLRTTRGGEWNGRNLARMLGLPRYGGHVVHQGKTVGTIPGDPILPADLFGDVHAILSSRRRGRRATGQYPLSGLVVCGRCQVTMNGTWNTRAGYREYRCPPTKGGCCRTIKAEPVEDLVSAHMVRLLGDPETAAAIVSADQALTDQRATAQTELDRITQRLVALEVKLASDEIPQEAYDAAKAVLDRKRNAAAATLAELAPAVSAARWDPRVEWRKLTTAQKVEAIRRYRVRVEVGAHIPRHRFDSDRVVISGPA